MWTSMNAEEKIKELPLKLKKIILKRLILFC